MGIEPTFEAWEAPVLPLNYTRVWQQPADCTGEYQGCHHLMAGEWWWSELRNRVPIHQIHPGIPKIIAFSPSGKYRWLNIPTDFPCHDKQTCKPGAGSQLLLILKIMGIWPQYYCAQQVSRCTHTSSTSRHPKKWRHKAAISQSCY